MADSKNMKGQSQKAIDTQRFGNIPLYACGVLSVLVIALGAVAFNYSQKTNKLLKVAGSLNEKVKDLEKPKYDEKYDFLTNQCDQGAYCVSVDTNNPSLEIYKFLVNFRETPNFNYRLFFEVSVGKSNVTQPYKLSCDAQDSQFYICQEISATSPTDVMRVFATSYKTLSKDATYSFNLMIKPISENEEPLPVKMTPNPNQVVKPIDTTNVVDVSAASEPMPAEGMPTEEAVVVDEIPKQANESIADKLVSN